MADGIGKRGIVAQQNVRAALQNRHPQTVAAQCVGHFHADVAGSDHHRAPRLPIAQEGAQTFRIVKRVQSENVRLAAAGNAGSVAP